MHLRFHPWQGIAALAVASAVISGCGSVPQAVAPVADASNTRPSAAAPAATPATRTLPVLPPAGSGRGGYYQDDGPGEAPPDGLHDIPDAEPKVEAYGRRGNRPYVVFGKSYKPFTDDRPFKQRGIGSWYGKKFHGQMTSSGEIYDMYKMTAAHPTLPLPSYVRVTNVRNGKQVIVRVNDRGPFHAGRIIDLSYTAALKLEYVSKGRAELEVERLLPDEIARINSARQNRSDSEQATAASIVQPVTVVQSIAGAATPLPNKDASQPASMIVPDIGLADRRVAEPPAGAASPAAVAGPVAAGGFYLQFGAYGNAANAEAMRSRLAQTWNIALPPLEVAQHGALYRIYSGPFVSRSDADAAARQAHAAGAAGAMIVQR
jgi:rare lipoprotein A